MAAAINPDATPRVGAYNQATWASLMESSERLDTGYISEVYKYGMLSSVFDIMDLAGRRISLGTRNPKVFEKGEWENTVKTGTAIAVGTAGASISFTIDSDFQDTIVEGQTFLIPGTYQTSGDAREYVVTDISSSVVTALPKTAAGTSITAAQISVEVPLGTELSILSYSTGTGTDMPDGKYNYRTSLQYHTQIIKTAKYFEGGAQALKWLEVNSETGPTSCWYEGQEELELEHAKMCEGAFWLGEENDNTALTEASGVGGTNARLATKGVYRWAEELGSTMNYTSGAWDYSDFGDVKDLFLANMVTANDASFYMGSDLQYDVENGGLDFVAAYSGGSDLFMKMDKLGINVRFALINGINFKFQELKALSNPQRFGNKVYDYSKSGLIIPESFENAEIEGKNEKHASLQIGYLNNNGEDRTRIMSLYDGTTGRGKSSHQGDWSSTSELTEFAALPLRSNQMIPVKPS